MKTRVPENWINNDDNDIIFVFNKNRSIGTAYYDHFANIIVINCGEVLKSTLISEDEKLIFITWQIEHEVLHAVIDKLIDIKTSRGLDCVSWTIQDKKEFLEIIKIAKKLGYKYHGRCKYLEK